MVGDVTNWYQRMKECFGVAFPDMWVARDIKLDVVGWINPKSSKGHMYILTTTNYFTKWTESVALKKVDAEELIRFLKENFMSLFCVPNKFITRNDLIFIGSKVTDFCR